MNLQGKHTKSVFLGGKMSDHVAHDSFSAEILTRHGRCGGLIVRSSPEKAVRVGALTGDIASLYSQSAALSSTRCING